MFFFNKMIVFVIILIRHFCITCINILHCVFTMKLSIHFRIQIHFAYARSCIFLKIFKISIIISIKTKTFYVAADHCIVIFKIFCNSVLRFPHFIRNIILIGFVFFCIKVLCTSFLSWRDEMIC